MTFELDRLGPKPIFIQIRDWMLGQILDGVWPEHYKLKAETDLATELDVNRGTVRKAITELIDQGYLTRIHGRGTFVASGKLEQPLAEQFITFSEDLIAKGITFETRVLAQSVEAPSQDVASLLDLQPGQSTFFLKRVRSIANEPLVVLENYLAYPHCPGIEHYDFTLYRLFEVLEDHLQLHLDWGQRSFEAQLADSQVADILLIPQQSPVIFAEQIVYLSNGSPIELSNLWFRADRFRLASKFKRNKDLGVTQQTLSHEYKPHD